MSTNVTDNAMELNKELEAELVGIEVQCDELEDHIDQLVKEKNDIKDKYEHLKTERELLLRELSDQRISLTGQKLRYSREIEKLQNRNNELVKEIDKLKEENVQLDNENIDLVVENRDLKKENEELINNGVDEYYNRNKKDIMAEIKRDMIKTLEEMDAENLKQHIVDLFGKSMLEGDK